jgi:hypothetical protein
VSAIRIGSGGVSARTAGDQRAENEPSGMATDCHVVPPWAGTPARACDPRQGFRVAIRLDARIPYLGQQASRDPMYVIGLHRLGPPPIIDLDRPVGRCAGEAGGSTGSVVDGQRSCRCRAARRDARWGEWPGFAGPEGTGKSPLDQSISGAWGAWARSAWARPGSPARGRRAPWAAWDRSPRRRATARAAAPGP